MKSFFAAVMISFEEILYSVEEGSSIEVCGEVSQPTEAPISVTISDNGDTALQNTDFTLSLSTLSFQPGQIRSCTVVSAVDDVILEEDEDFTLALLSSNNRIQVSQTAGMTTVVIPNQDSELKIDI